MRSAPPVNNSGPAADTAPVEPAPAVAVQELVKTYPKPGGGSFKALDGVSFEVRRGEIFGFLGPNGAGKTTTLEIVEGLKEPTSGRVSVLGLDSRRERKEVKDRIGVQLQVGAYFDFLSLEEILELFGSFYTKRLEPAELLDRVGLWDKRRAYVKHLSGGQARRFSVIAALVNDPEVVFLDEPTTGLDPQARRSVWDLISAINRDEGKTVLLTTHYMEEAETLSHRIAIIDRGRIQTVGTPSTLIRGLRVASRIRFTTPQPVETAQLARLPGVVGVEAGPDGGSYELRAVHADDALAGLLRWSQSLPARLQDIEVQPATLEDVFLSVTGRRLRD